jgi:hypothetical protein
MTTGGSTTEDSNRFDWLFRTLDVRFRVSLCIFVALIVVGLLLVDYNLFARFRNLLGGFALGVGIRGIFILLQQANTLLANEQILKNESEGSSTSIDSDDLRDDDEDSAPPRKTS